MKDWQHPTKLYYKSSSLKTIYKNTELFRSKRGINLIKCEDSNTFPTSWSSAHTYEMLEHLECRTLHLQTISSKPVETKQFEKNTLRGRRN